jgi:hypothetical protein
MTTTNPLMLFRENHKEQRNTLCGQNAELFYVTACGAHTYRWASEGETNKKFMNLTALNNKNGADMGNHNGIQTLSRKS